jgi:acetyltransferase-like isoleucine patch superfamily enzyme
MEEFIKPLLITHPFLLKIASIVYNIFYLNYSFHGNFSGVFMKRTKFKIKGSNINIKCGQATKLVNCILYVQGNNIDIIIGKKCSLRNLEIWIEDDNGRFTIGDNTTIEGGHIAVTEGGVVEIGDDCMFSSNIQIRNGDSHSIYDSVSKIRLNSAKSVKIGNHVWLGANSTVLKGVTIADNSIIATGAIVNSACLEENSIYGGIPAKKVRSDIYWDRQR